MVSTLTKVIVLFSLFITLTTGKAQASPEYDRVYQLESVSWLKASDNVDGMFGDFIDDQYTKYFSGHDRFQVKKIDSLSGVLENSKAPYVSLIDNVEVIRKISKKLQIESLIRTKVYKESLTYRFVLEWVYAPKSTVLSSVEFRFADPGKEKGLIDSELPNALRNALDQLILQLPFRAQVTGIEGQVITVNIGRSRNVKPREILTIYTLQGVKIHPKLNTIEEWKWQPVGRAQVEQVEESMSFARITELEEGANVLRFQKVREILPAPPAPVQVTEKGEAPDSPRIGWIAGGVGLGSYIREASDGLSKRIGGNGLGGVIDVESMIWFNSRYLVQASLNGAFMGYSPTDLNNNSTELGESFSGTFSQLRLALGYSLFPAQTIFDTIGWVHFGYRTTNYALAGNDTTLTGGSSFDTLFLGIGGELPFRKLLTVQMNFDIGLVNSANLRAPAFGSPSTVTDLMFEVATVFHKSEKWNLRMALKLNSQSMDFTTGEAISQKLLSVGPSLLYYF